MRSKKGFSLIESLLVVAMVGIIVVLMANLPNAFNLMSKSKNLSLAREIATKQIEDKRAIDYNSLANDSTVLIDSRIGLLPNGEGLVVVEDCDISICTNSEPVKQIIVTVSWMENNKSQSVTLQTFVGEGGLNQ